MRQATGYGKKDALKVMIGVLVLFAGAMVYVIDRPAQATYFIHFRGIDLSLHGKLHSVFGCIGGSLPTLVHPFAFILITAGLCSAGPKEGLIISLGWMITNLAFEFFQKYNSWLVVHIPQWFNGVPFLENTKNYFVYGTFDGYDVASILVGSLFAYMTLRYIDHKYPPVAA